MQEPLLGLATTMELLVELECRFRMERYKTGGAFRDAEKAAQKCRVMLAALPNELLDYRTVDAETEVHGMPQPDGSVVEVEAPAHPRTPFFPDSLSPMKGNE